MNTDAAPANTPSPFGTRLGIAPGGVAAYSSDYDTADERKLPNRSAFRSYHDGVYMGYKWQCVEFARRWMYVNKGQIFDDVAMAYEIFRLRSVRDVRNKRVLPLRSFRNGSPRHPVPGSLLIWAAGGEFETTGHVAVVTEVLPDRIRLAEQNVDHRVWPAGQEYGREIAARITDDGGYWIRCSFGDATILGWVMQTDDDTHAEPVVETDRRLYNLRAGRVPDRGQTKRSWLNVANLDEAAYVDMMEGHRLAATEENQHLFFSLSESAHEELTRATNELHALFMHATEYVLQHDELWAQFNLPPVVWPKIRQSWDNRKNQMITGRFDFSVSERGVKVYEYNCDSASCHMETAKIQAKWADHFGCDIGRDPGANLFRELVDAWKESDVDDVLHILIDRDLEETYHALFMQEALEDAGIRSKLLRGMAGVAWNEAGEIVDADGEKIRWVWKTWAWETALDQIRADYEAGGDVMPGQPRAGSPRLVDVLLRPEVMVYEPLWTLIPSNKAILPVLWRLFPNHPYLLDASFELTDELRAKGYVEKPIVGRCGSNIRIYGESEELLEQTDGRFDTQSQVYQQFFKLPVVGGTNVQVCTFSAAGTYAGSCVRVDPTLVITSGSDMVALRVISDRELLDAAGRFEGWGVDGAGYQI